MKKTNSLFKYVKSEYANIFFRVGSVRIGTLHEYRNTEKYGNVIGDHQERILNEDEHYDNLTIGSDEEVPSFVRGRLKVGKGTVQLINSKITLSDQSPDYYMYCLSTEFDPKVMKEFGCNTCIEIHNVQQFINSLNHCMRHKGKFVGAFNCIYTEKSVPPGEKPNYHPALVKAPKYANQKEVRLLWEPKKTNPKPIYMSCRKIPRYCNLA